MCVKITQLCTSFTSWRNVWHRPEYAMLVKMVFIVSLSLSDWWNCVQPLVDRLVKQPQCFLVRA